MNKSKLYSIIALVLIVGVLAGFFWLLSLEKKNREFMSQWSENQVPDTQLAGWKTYRNEKYGFEFRYPNGWEVTVPELLSVSLESPNGSVVLIFPVGGSGSGLDENAKIIESTVKVGEHQARRVDVYNKDEIVFSNIEIQDEIRLPDFRIEFQLPKKPDFQILNTILSTFKFIE